GQRMLAEADRRVDDAVPRFDAAILLKTRAGIIVGNVAFAPEPVEVDRLGERARHGDAAGEQVPAIFDLAGHVDVAGRAPAQGQPGEHVAQAGIVVAIEGVDDIAVLVGELAREADAQRVADRAADDAGQADALALEIIAGGDEGLEPVGRARRHQADRPRRRVAAEKGALRPAQYLHALEIEEGSGELGAAPAV